MIDYEILQDIITDHELCKVQENELAKVVELLKADRLIELPCKVGDTVYEIYRFCIYGAWEIDEHRVTLEDLPHIGKTVFLTKEEAEKALAELKGTEE